ncbi:uncharacterized protein N7496_011257 [Penicillium cataractarum]|uniref:Uncharacterized protein n=1 Tax=Penicillium cataractarum TaxID=2100454 RepID=A0A9W9RGI1_9EURO|nr:uncharacterized protein N7496_011257 [Penicillium cataractarum]KAJ5358844.1 hypothetical protein N7496_011257 [Penicillium cataractarum]
MATVYPPRINKKAVFDKLRLELKVHHIDVSEMVLERFSLILPGTDASQEQLKVLQTFLVQPMLVTNEELKQIMRLEPSNAVPSFKKNVLSREHAFYMRSWSMTPIQLYDISKHLQEEGRTFPELDEWKFISFMAGTRNVTVRYIGSTNCTTTVSRRFADDTNNKSRNSLLGAFQSCLEEGYPFISQRAEIHLLPDISFDILGSGNHIGNQLNSDDTESLLIQLFGCRSLLNLQLGGHYIRYLPREEDETIFESLHTRYIRRIMSEGSQFPDNKWSSIKNQFAAVFAEKLSLDRVVSRAAKGALENQAKPHQYLGTTIAVFVGEELTDSHLQAGCSFFDGNSKSSRLVGNLVHRIKHIEERNFIGDNMLRLGKLSKAFPFINVIEIL